jgi:hypothetical protein
MAPPKTSDAQAKRRLSASGSASNTAYKAKRRRRKPPSFAERYLSTPLFEGL